MIRWCPDYAIGADQLRGLTIKDAVVAHCLDRSHFKWLVTACDDFIRAPSWPLWSFVHRERVVRQESFTNVLHTVVLKTSAFRTVFRVKVIVPCHNAILKPTDHTERLLHLRHSCLR